MITSVKEILENAQKGGYAVGAFNTTNLETTRAIIDAANEMKSPVIVQITEKTMEYAGGRAIFNLVKNSAEFYAPEIPIGIHLDHGKSVEIIERCAEIGFPSVMYDGSRKIFVDNVSVTKEVVEFCHKRGMAVQGELGSVPYLGETGMGDIDWDEYMTDPEEAERFVSETGIDALAVAIGNAHGFFKERKEPDYKRLEEIRKRVSIPLILHGASDWENGRVVEVIKRGVCCFNVDTSIRLAFVNSLVKAVRAQNDISFDIRKLLGDARKAVKNSVKEKIRFFGSEGKA
ncbi:MAG TPA: class II fructose-bisphosphate aldolase [Candidatus Moranbacteria bacterium]|jgi:fructose-bisphosphate aldolase class II|nr:class II fructose-bisphosphate aldolase [Candidatus Moranbacteria bacterium]HPX94417.1 class II fructose-bisphosphate aldolase [Candidatus Moranbacteria bacterium]HQB59427.1 class II fructose-bisphosphate aldolase [Candidatus Moranbacteria bacterium]